MLEMGIPLTLVEPIQMYVTNAHTQVRVRNNFAFEQDIRKIAPELTEAFANQGSKLVLAVADDVDTVIISTRDVREVKTKKKN